MAIPLFLLGEPRQLIGAVWYFLWSILHTASGQPHWETNTSIILTIVIRVGYLRRLRSAPSKNGSVTDRAFNYYWRREGKRVAEFSRRGKRLKERSATIGKAPPRNEAGALPRRGLNGDRNAAGAIRLALRMAENQSVCSVAIPTRMFGSHSSLDEYFWQPNRERL